MNIVELEVKQEHGVSLDLKSRGDISLGIEPGSGTTDYNRLSGKPSIEGHTLIGDSTLPQIGVNDITPQSIDNIIYG